MQFAEAEYIEAEAVPRQFKFILPICKIKVGTSGKRQKTLYGHSSVPHPNFHRRIKLKR